MKCSNICRLYNEYKKGIEYSKCVFVLTTRVNERNAQEICVGSCVLADFFSSVSKQDAY